MPTTLITGTSTGIGQATALSMARAGHQVFATMRDLSRAGELQAAAQAEKLPITILQLDVDQDDSVRRAIAGIGPVDVLVNNAGIPTGGPIEETPLADFKQCFETNFFGALRCIQAVIPGMRERRSGCIVNITSVAGRIASPPQAAYASSKWALEALSEVLAGEMKAFGVRVLIVEPGVIATPIFQKAGYVRENSPYPHARRMMAMFRALLQNPTPPSVVGDKIRDIVQSGTWQLRHPAGPDAQGFLDWRKSVSDEEWINGSALSEEEWYAQMQRDFGFDFRPKAAGQ